MKRNKCFLLSVLLFAVVSCSGRMEKAGKEQARLKGLQTELREREEQQTSFLDSLNRVSENLVSYYEQYAVTKEKRWLDSLVVYYRNELRIHADRAGKGEFEAMQFEYGKVLEKAGRIDEANEIYEQIFAVVKKWPGDYGKLFRAECNILLHRGTNDDYAVINENPFFTGGMKKVTKREDLFDNFQ